MLARVTAAVVRRPLVVIGVWVAVALAGLVSASPLQAMLSTSLQVPGSSSAIANAALSAHFGDNQEGSFTVVLHRNAITAAQRTALRHELEAVVAPLPGATVSPATPGQGVVVEQVSTPDDLNAAAKLTPQLRHLLAASTLAPAEVTGPPAIQYDVGPVLAHDLAVGELVAALAALLLLAFTLGVGWSLLVPLLAAAATTSGALLACYGLAHVVLMVLYVPNVVQLIGFGLAVDYSLLIVQRYRREAAVLGPGPEALAATMSSAGRTVATSGAAVAVGLSLLALVPVPFLRSLGVAGLVVPVVAVLAALSLVPCLLSLLGPAALRSRVGYLADPSDLSRSARRWAGLGRRVTARAGLVALGASALLALLAWPIVGLELTPGSLTSLPPSLPSAQALGTLESHVGLGALTPIQVVFDAGQPGAARRPAVAAAALRFATTLLGDPEVGIILLGPGAPYVDPTGQWRRVLVVARDQFGAPATQALVHRLRAELATTALPRGVTASSGGAPAQGVDFLQAVRAALPWLVGVAMVVTALVLFAAYRSVALALGAVLLTCASVAASMGLLSFVVANPTSARLLGIHQSAQLEAWVPLFCVAVLFGLSMDYEVFLVAAMVEGARRGEEARTAVIGAMASTGRVVTAAAAIMAAAVAGLALGQIAGLQQVGLGLCIGVLLDVTVVRGLLLPSAVTLLGRRAFWPADALRPAPEGTGRSNGVASPT